MARSNIRLNHKGLAALLKSPRIAALVEAKAEEVADNVRARGIGVGDRDGGPREIDLPVKVVTGTTDRARASVQLAHPAGNAVQAKHGALTKAAAQAGLDVRSKS